MDFARSMRHSPTTLKSLVNEVKTIDAFSTCTMSYSFVRSIDFPKVRDFEHLPAHIIDSTKATILAVASPSFFPSPLLFLSPHSSHSAPETLSSQDLPDWRMRYTRGIDWVQRVKLMNVKIPRFLRASQMAKALVWCWELRVECSQTRSQSIGWWADHFLDGMDTNSDSLQAKHYCSHSDQQI